jgi:hypothetical protein
LRCGLEDYWCRDAKEPSCFQGVLRPNYSIPLSGAIESQREFTDEFNNPVHIGNRWRPVSGWWRIKDGQLLQSVPWRSSLPGDFQSVYVYGLASGPYEAETRLNFLTEGEQAAGLLLRFQDQNNFYLLRIRHYPNWQDHIDLTQYISGVRRKTSVG